VVARSLGQAEAYLTVREVLAGASTGADGVHWREFSGFGRFRFATLGLNHNCDKVSNGKEYASLDARCGNCLRLDFNISYLVWSESLGVLE
jgi:hypothetical protein